MKKWKAIALTAVGGFGLVIAAIAGAGAGAGALQSAEPLVPISEAQKQQDQQIADRWMDELHLTAEQRKQVRDLGIDLSHGLLEAIWVFTQIPIEVSAEALKPVDVKFQDMERIIVKEYPDGRKEVIRETVSKLVQARTYNGLHRFRYKMETTVTYQGDVKITITEPVVEGEDWDRDYSRINDFLRRANFLTKEDRLLIYRQALAYDPTFGDPEAQEVLLEEIGGGMPAGAIPKGMPLPPEEITRALKEAIRLTGVNEAEWLPALQWMVMKESGGNPHAYNKTPVWYSAKWGYQNARGLLQLMPPTFFAYKLPGHDDIWNPVDNAAAAIRYIQSRYGSPYKIPGIFTNHYRGY